jgi:hypothetical protein
MRRVTAICLLLGLSAAVLTAGAKIQVQRDERTDFSTLKTWNWNPSGPGDVKIWVTAESKSEPVKKTYEPVIMQAVEDELARRGIKRVASGPVDFTVTYYVIITVGGDSQHMGQFLPPVTTYGVPPFAPQTTSLNIYPEGSLVLDIGAPGPDHVVWRAVAKSEVELDRTEAQRAERVRGLVRDIVNKLPKK